MEIIAHRKAVPVSTREDLRAADQANVAAKEKARPVRAAAGDDAGRSSSAENFERKRIVRPGYWKYYLRGWL
jgi:hypothetical protein